MLAQGLLDLALLSSNADQLRHTLDSPTDKYFLVFLPLISCSMLLQIAVAIALVFRSRYSNDTASQRRLSECVDNFIIISILLITITNVVASAFSPDNGKEKPAPPLPVRFFEAWKNLLTNWGNSALAVWNKLWSYAIKKSASYNRSLRFFINEHIRELYVRIMCLQIRNLSKVQRNISLIASRSAKFIFSTSWAAGDCTSFEEVIESLESCRWDWRNSSPHSGNHKSFVHNHCPFFLAHSFPSYH